MKDRPELGTEFPGSLDADVWKMVTFYRASYFKGTYLISGGELLNCWAELFEITSVRRAEDWLNQKSDL